MGRTPSSRKDLVGMSSSFGPKGRRGIPDQLRHFGRHLVYSEGTKTEPYYVQNIKECIANKYKVRPNDIELISVGNGRSFNTKSLVKHAIKDVGKRIDNGELIDHVWIFFDKDSFPMDHYKEAHKLIVDKNTSISDEGVPCDKNGIAWHSLPSNECFELFLLLYFNYETSAGSRKTYAKRIETNVQKVIPGWRYAKNLQDIHSAMITAGGKISNAIKFGKRLEKNNGLDNPTSLVYRFLEYFHPYLEQ